MKVSVLLLTLNEEANLPQCLDALSFCDDVVTVDSGSTDATRAICEARGVRVLNRPFDNFANQRNFGVDTAGFRNEWVLHLDADEVVTPEFIAALEALDPPSGIQAYFVPAKTMFFGKWLRRAGMWPSYQARLGRVDGLRFKQSGHGQREDLMPHELGVFPEAYLHYSFSHGLEAWLQKHLRYARDEVEELLRQRTQARAGLYGAKLATGATGSRRALKGLVARFPLMLRPLMKFSYVYFFRMGFLDGRRGLAYAFMLAVYEGMIAVIGFEKLGAFSAADVDLNNRPPTAAYLASRKNGATK
jgi:glycosyltransferase involved in cell wall biosynthesis